MRLAVSSVLMDSNGFSRGSSTACRIVDATLITEQLYREGFIYRKDQPKLPRTTLPKLLNNRFMIGEFIWHGRLFKGKQRSLIDKATFELCQEILDEKNRRVNASSLNLPLSGGLFRCKHCDCAISGEMIRKKQANGSIREHVYFFCSNNKPSVYHPKVRWRADDLENAIVTEIAKLKLPSPEITEWFRTSLRAALSHENEYRRRTHTTLVLRERELEVKRARLLDAYLAGSVEEMIFKSKTDELKIDLERVQEELG